MPLTTMLVLGRDDIRDCLLWMAGVVSLMVILAHSSKIGKEISKESRGYGRVDKVK